MRSVAVAKRGTVGIIQSLAGALVGFVVPSAAWSLGFVPALVVGLGLTAGGLYLAWKNRYLAFASGLWPLALISTAMMVLIVWGAASGFE